MPKQTRIPHSARRYVLASGIRMTLHATRLSKICVSSNDKQRTCDEKIAKLAQIASNRHRTQNIANARFLYFVCPKIGQDYVYTVLDSFRAATKIIADRDSVHTQKRLWRREKKKAIQYSVNKAQDKTIFLGPFFTSRLTRIMLWFQCLRKWIWGTEQSVFAWSPGLQKKKKQTKTKISHKSHSSFMSVSVS